MILYIRNIMIYLISCVSPLIELLLRHRLPTRKMCVCVGNKGAGQTGDSCDTPKMCPHQQNSNLQGFRVNIGRQFSLKLCWEPKVSKSKVCWSSVGHVALNTLSCYLVRS